MPRATGMPLDVTSAKGPDDVVVVGAPRSGTSLVAQLLAGAEFATGDDLLPATADNPLGFVERVAVSEINDDLLEAHVVGDGPGQVPVRRLAWLAAPPDHLDLRSTSPRIARCDASIPARHACGR